MTKPRFVFSIAVLLLGWIALLLSIYADIAFDNYEWFNRSGAILVACSALLETLQLPLKESLSSYVTVNKKPVALAPVVSRSVRFFDRVAWVGIAFGTIIWAYGDLVVARF